MSSTASIGYSIKWKRFLKLLRARVNLLMPEYMSDEYDAPLNGKADSAVAAAFLSW